MGKEVFRNDWLHLYSGFERVHFEIGPASYFDDRAHICITPTFLIPFIGIFFTGFSLLSLIWVPFLIIGYGTIYLDLPIHSGIDEAEPPRYGFYWYNSEGAKFNITSFVWCWKSKIKFFHMPWEYDWVRTSKLKKDGTWEHETYKNRKSFYKDDWKDILWFGSYPYTYVLKDGTIQQRMATICVEEREWRWRSFKWLPFPKMIRKTIDVEFSYNGQIHREVLIEKKGYPLKNKQLSEIGEQTGSWKGGTIGCGYSMKPGESPLDTLRRMERERKFD